MSFIYRKAVNKVTKKEIFTDAEIEKDIKAAIKAPPDESEDSHKKWLIFMLILAPFSLLALLFIEKLSDFLWYFAWALLIITVLIFPLSFLYLKIRLKNVSIRDYEVSEDKVFSAEEERYTDVYRTTRLHFRTVKNYNVNFCSGKTWRIPGELYFWSDRYRMKNYKICESTHAGDTMIVVTHRKTKKVIVAYNTELFEYKSSWY